MMMGNQIVKSMLDGGKAKTRRDGIALSVTSQGLDIFFGRRVQILVLVAHGKAVFCLFVQRVPAS